MKRLENIHSPKDIKKLSTKELTGLCAQFLSDRLEKIEH